MRYAGVCFISKDVLKLASFYEKVFGCPINGDAWHAELSFAGLNLAIFAHAGMEEMAPGSMQRAGTGSSTLMFEVDDADAEFARLQALGVNILKLPATYEWGSRSFWFRDPDGNIIDFFSRVKA